MHWSGLASDFGKVIKTFQAHVITEMATLGLACSMISAFTQMEVTEVTRRGKKADYWLGDRELMSDLAHPQRRDRDSVGETAAAFPQLECPCGTLCADDQESCLDRLIPNAISSSNSGEPARDRISLLTLCATPNDSATADVSRSPSPQVAVIIARWANFCGSPAREAAFSQRRKMLAESTAFTPGRVGTIP
jgi:hypothetical protein